MVVCLLLTLTYSQVNSSDHKMEECLHWPMTKLWKEQTKKSELRIIRHLLAHLVVILPLLLINPDLLKIEQNRNSENKIVHQLQKFPVY